MNARNLLFLLGGGSTIFDAVAEEFIPAAGGPDATIALLLAGGQGREDYVSQYTQPWIRRGVTRCYIIVPGKNGALDLDTALARLRQSTGIFVGGGDTPTYHCLYAADPIRSMIRQRYWEGVPIAGLSAAASTLARGSRFSTGNSMDDGVSGCWSRSIVNSRPPNSHRFLR